MFLLIIFFWGIFIFIYYLIYNYQHSRNKHLFFKTGVYRSLIWTFSILAVSPLIVNFLLPEVNLELGTVQKIMINEIQQQAFLLKGDLLSYYANVLSYVFRNINLTGFISAVLILITWCIYIRSLDFFNKDHIKYPIITILLGAAFSLLTLALSDYFSLLLDIQYSDSSLYNLLVYCFLGIGAVEELIKFIPFLIIFRFTRVIDEPFDYIQYASMSALGFAFVENLIYFQDLSEMVIQGRALMSAVGHIIFASVVVYGLVLARYRDDQSAFLYFLIFFMLGSFLHGLYDFLIFEGLIILLLPLFILAIQGWTIIVNNTINNSTFFDFKISFQAERSRFYLAVMLSVILAFNYFVNAIQFGIELANTQYITACAFGGMFVVFYVTNMSNYDLVKGHWRPFVLRLSSPGDNMMYALRGFGTIFTVFRHNFISALNIVHYKISLKPPYYNHWLYANMSESEGVISDRIRLYDSPDTKEIIDTDWFLVSLQDQLFLEGFADRHLLIKLERKNSSLIHDEDIRGYIRLIPNLRLLEGEKPQKKDFPSAGYILINCTKVPEYYENGTLPQRQKNL